MSMLTSIDIVFSGPQIRIPYIMFVEAPLLEKGIYGVTVQYIILELDNRKGRGTQAE
jgi:hypothetical protein